MEREIVALRKQVADAQATPGSVSQQSQLTPKVDSTQPSPDYPSTSALSADHMGSQEAVASLLDLRSGLDGANSRNGNHHFKRIEDVVVPPDNVAELFDL